MSMPKFPEIDPEITCDRALNMILASIAMEELALSHILNAEGEKLQYILGTLETSSGLKPEINEILKVNQSVTCLLDSVSQIEMLLKNKMDKALHVFSEICPKPIKPPKPPCPPKPSEPLCIPDPPCSKGLQSDRGPTELPGLFCYPCKCSAVFKKPEKYKLWCTGSALPWKIENLHGKYVCLDPCDKTKIELRSKERFAISFAVNVRAKDCKCNAVISLQIIENYQRKDIYNVCNHVPYDDEAVTMSMGGIIIENSNPASYLLIKLESPGSLIVENCILSIMEV